MSILIGVTKRKEKTLSSNNPPAQSVYAQGCQWKIILLQGTKYTETHIVPWDYNLCDMSNILTQRWMQKIVLVMLSYW